MIMSVDQARHAAQIPSVGVWAGISDDEREYRAQVLDDIAKRVAAEGVYRAMPGDDRGRQFMPFAALKGFDEVVAEGENEG
mgnify:CR=1 FL=1